MNTIATGSFFGNHFLKKNLNGLVVTDTAYTHSYVDWHRHENPYLTMVLAGDLKEKGKGETHTLLSGNMLFHHAEEAHCNYCSDIQKSRGAHLEFTPEWLKRLDLNPFQAKFPELVRNPQVGTHFYSILLELRINDLNSSASIEWAGLEIYAQLESSSEKRTSSTAPGWVFQLEELLWDSNGVPPSIATISKILGIHPVHLSRSFSRFFPMGFGQYCREIRLLRTAMDIHSKKFSMAEIAYRNHFSDQSHMIAAVKRRFGKTPSAHLRALG